MWAPGRGRSGARFHVRREGWDKDGAAPQGGPAADRTRREGADDDHNGRVSGGAPHPAALRAEVEQRPRLIAEGPGSP
ncbi:hypothetical protein GCM10009800_05760 [Nocardiopsis rhodophaea]